MTNGEMLSQLTGIPVGWFVPILSGLLASAAYYLGLCVGSRRP